MKFLTGTEGRFVRAVLAYVLAGRLRLPGGRYPPAGHSVPEGFAGVGVAAAGDPAVDDYILARLGELGIRQVRIDFTYGDADAPAARLLDRLCANGFRVMLHLLQPFAAARRMAGDAAAREDWRRFVAETLDRFGARVAMVEIGSTVNRQRWAGYTLDGFLAMWEIAHREVRARGLTLAGPSVTDFEPPWNIGLLSLLRARGQLPDLHSDNLFAERASEPERYDHKVLGRLLAPLLRVNLVKKARLLQKIAADFGVPRLISPAAFWTLPRIERVLPASEQKQADYLARYLVLCAASGALEAAWWGPLICHREGLVDDGEPQYPALERITHYAGVAAALGAYRERPALAALATFARLIPGARYEGRLNRSCALEVHAFRSAHMLIHVVWTINGRAAALADIYAADDLRAACILSRDGDSAEGSPPCLAGESPIYLRWPAERRVGIAADVDVLGGVAVHWHVDGKRYFLVRDAGWQGIVLAADEAEASRLLSRIHPAVIGLPPQEKILRNARNVIWTIDDPRFPERKLVVKKPVRIAFHKRLLDRFKPSKGLRSWSGTCELLRRGVDAAMPVAFFEKSGGFDPANSYYICEHVAADCTARELAADDGSQGGRFPGVSHRDALAQLSEYLLRMHACGVWFRDLSGGNVLVRNGGEGKLSFALIDTGRLRANDRPLSLGERVADLVRICNKMDAASREQFLALYMGRLGVRLPWWRRLAFAAYDFKVALKRRFGRKAVRRLVRRAKDGRA